LKDSLSFIGDKFGSGELI